MFDGIQSPVCGTSTKRIKSRRMLHKTLRCWLSFERLSGLSSLWGSWGWGGTWRWWGWGAGAGGKFFLRLTSLLRGPAWSIIISGFVKTFQKLRLSVFYFTSCAAKRLIMERRAKKERRYILGKPISLPLVSFAQCPLQVSLAKCPLPSVPCRWWTCSD